MALRILQIYLYLLSYKNREIFNPKKMIQNIRLRLYAEEIKMENWIIIHRLNDL